MRGLHKSREAITSTHSFITDWGSPSPIPSPSPRLLENKLSRGYCRLLVDPASSCQLLGSTNYNSGRVALESCCSFNTRNDGAGGWVVHWVVNFKATTHPAPPHHPSCLTMSGCVCAGVCVWETPESIVVIKLCAK